MKKHYKLFIVLAVVLVALTIVLLTKEEKEVENNSEILDAEMLEVKMINFRIDTDYNDVEYEVRYSDDYNNNTYVAEIIKKDTNEVVDFYHESPTIPLDVAKKVADGSCTDEEMMTYVSLVDASFTMRNINDYKISAYVWTRVNINANPSGRQINEVIDASHAYAGGGFYTLTPAETYCNNDEFPITKNLEFQINGMIGIPSQKADEFGFKQDFLESIGFEILVNPNDTWGASTSYNKIVAFKLI